VIIENYSFATPIICDQRLAFPFVTLEAKLDGSEKEGTLQNSHNAAIMLRNMRKICQKVGKDLECQFDGKIRVLTITICKNVIKLFGNWTCFAEDKDLLEYRFCLLHAWSLGPEDTCWIEARNGLEQAVRSMMTQTLIWLNALKPSGSETTTATTTTASRPSKRSYDLVLSNDTESVSTTSSKRLKSN